MNYEKLEEAKVLKNKIELLEKRLDIWEKSKRLASINLTNVSGYGENVDSNYVNFDVLKTLTVDAIKGELSDVKKEFEAL